MNIVLIGTPGSGKGTQAKLLEQYFHIPHISTGDLLRQEINHNNSLSEQLKNSLDAGKLVSDEIMLKLVYNRLAAPDCKNGFILDGFPRTIAQAKSLQQKGIGIDYVVEIQLADSIITKRMSGRRIHRNSGRIYHIEYNPPKIAGKDDFTGEKLEYRSDNHPEVIAKRLKSYHEETLPLRQFYHNTQNMHKPKYITVNADQAITKIRDQIVSQIIHH